jgi:hypothetical protein
MARSKRAHASGFSSINFAFSDAIMPPQPLSSVRSNAIVKMGPVDLSVRPEAALWVSKCIAAWSEVEFQLGLMMTAFLGEAAIPTVAIYLELLAFRTRVQALAAAAPKTISLEHEQIFDALIFLARAATKKRDRLAHWLWTYSEQVPEALLLIDPRDLLPQFTHRIIKALAGQKTTEEDAQISKNLIWVYRPIDLIEIHTELSHLRNLIAAFNKMVLLESNVSEQYKLYYALSHEPLIQEYVSRQRAAQ